jgi:hypothetical protein
VVGVIANARTQSLAQADVPQLYLNVYQNPAKHLAIFLRGHLDLTAIEEQVREQVQALDPTLPVFGAHTLSHSIRISVAAISMEMVGAFALTALLLATLEIYGVILYRPGSATVKHFAHYSASGIDPRACRCRGWTRLCIGCFALNGQVALRCKTDRSSDVRGCRLSVPGRCFYLPVISQHTAP